MLNMKNLNIFNVLFIVLTLSLSGFHVNAYANKQLLQEPGGNKIMITEQEVLKKLVGKTVLVTINIYKDINNKKVGKVESIDLAMKVIRIEDSRVVLLPVGSHQEFGLPPDINGFIPAKPGSYQLKNGNIKEIKKPDYVTGFNLNENNPDLEDYIRYGFRPG